MEIDVVYSYLVRGQVKKLYFTDADTGAKSSDMPPKNTNSELELQLSAFASNLPECMSAPAVLYVQCKSTES